MRKTLFWSGIYCSLAFFVIGIYNIWYDQTTKIVLENLGHPTFSEALNIVVNNQQQVINNQQITHIVTIAIVIFLLVRFYYERHPSEASAVLISKTTKEEIKQIHPDIPQDYFDDPAKKSVEDRKQDIVNDNNQKEGQEQ